MKRIFTLITLLSALTIQAQFDAQGKLSKQFKRDFSFATGSWFDQDFAEALKLFKTLSDSYPKNAYLKFVVGDCYLQSASNKADAIPYLEQACDSLVADMTYFDYEDPKNTKAPFSAVLQLGIAYRINYEFDKSIEKLNLYQKLWGDKITDGEKTEVQRQLRMSKAAQFMVNHPVKIKVSNLGEAVNSPQGDYAPVISADEKVMIFTSRRGKEGDPTDPEDFKYYEDIYISEKNDNDEWGTPKKISDNINTPGHEGSIGLSVDGQQLLIYSSKDDYNGDIYLSTLEGDVWSPPVPFTEINSKHSETHACFNVDGTEVYFTSNRPTGPNDNIRDFDLYKIVKLPDGSWSLPRNLGPTVNTIYDEGAPFIHPDGVTLYFTSKGHSTMGGFDIFQTTIDDENFTWRTPENLGYPINTTGDDVFFVTSVDGSRAYYSSEKGAGSGEKDLYMMTLIEKQKDQKALTVMVGKLSMGENQEIPEDAQITVKDVETGEIIGVYRPNRKTGKYLFILPPGRTYDVSYEIEGYLFKSENLIVPTSSGFDQIRKEINLSPVQANESIVLNNVFFKYDSDEIIEESLPDLEKLAKLLVKNDKIVIEISGHTDSKGEDAYNQRLSEQRAKSVRQYLLRNGVAANRVTAIGFGEKKPIARNQNPDGSDNPEGRQLNRRIELKVLATDGKTKTTVKKIEVPKGAAK